MANKEEMLKVLKALVDSIVGAEAITTFGVSSVAEFQERPTRHAAEKVPTGWVNIGLNIRLYQRRNDAR